MSYKKACWEPVTKFVQEFVNLRLGSSDLYFHLLINMDFNYKLINVQRYINDRQHMKF